MSDFDADAYFNDAFDRDKYFNDKFDLKAGETPDTQEASPERGLKDYALQFARGGNRAYAGLADMIIGNQSKGLDFAANYGDTLLTPYRWAGKELGVLPESMRTAPAWWGEKESTPVSDLTQPARDFTQGWLERSERAIPKDESRLADALYTAGEWTMPIGKATKLDPVIGAAAVTGEQIAGDVGEVIGGLSPLAFLLGKAGVTKYKSAVGEGDKISDKLSEWYMSQLHDKAAALRNLTSGINAGQAGDLADLTRDPGAANIIGGVPRGSKTDVALNTIEKAVQDQTGNMITDAFKVGDATAAQDYARGRALEKTMQARQGAQQATQDITEQASRMQREAVTDPRAVAQQLRGDDATKMLESAGRVERAAADLPQYVDEAARAEAATKTDKLAYQASQELSGAYKAYKETLQKDLTKPAWKAFDESDKMHTASLYKTVMTEIRNEFSSGVAKQIRDLPAMQVLRWMVRSGKEQTPKNLNFVASQLKKAAHNQNTEDTYKAALSKAADTIDTILTAKYGEMFTQAKEATVRTAKLMGDHTVQDARMRSSAETLGNTLFKEGELGATNAKAMLETVLRDPEYANPAIADAMENYILTQAEKQGLDDQFLTKYQDFLDVWKQQRPEFVSRLTDSVESKQVLDATAQSLETMQTAEEATRKLIIDNWQKQGIETAEKGRKRLSGAVEKSQLNAYSKAPKETIYKALTAETDTNFNMLKNSFKSAKAQADFGAEVSKVLADIATGKKGLSGEKQYTAFKRRIESLLGEGGLQKLADVEMREAVKRMKARAGSQRYKDTPEQIKEDTMKTMGAWAMSKMPGTNALLMAGFARRSIGRGLENSKGAQERIEKLAALEHAFLTNPQSLLDAWTARNSRAAVDRWILNAMNQAGSSVLKAAAINQEGEADAKGR